MYSEKTFKNYIFWIQVKRVVLIILFSCIGAALGVLISELYESISRTNTFNVLIIVVSTVLMFLFSLLLTMGTGKEVQDGYWKIAVLRKLTTIQKLIETNNSLIGSNENIVNSVLNKEDLKKITDISFSKEINHENQTDENDVEYEDEDINEIQEEKDVKEEKNKNKMKNKKENNKKENNKKKRNIKKVKDLV